LPKVKLFLHEYSGHAFGIQLARELARQGHRVTYAYSAAIESPRGPVARLSDDLPGLEILPIGKPGSLDKYHPWKRVKAERNYGRELAAAIREASPDTAILSTTPDDVLDMVRRHVPSSLPLVWWVQDIYSVGIRNVLGRKSALAGMLAGLVYRGKERRFARRARRIIAITPAFVPFLEALGAPARKISLLENWAPVEEIHPLPQNNEWSRAQGLAGKRVILYSGTLGLKHNPALLVEAARNFRDRDDVVVLVVTQGLGADYLRREIATRKLSNLKLLPWQPHDQFPQVLASAAILTALIEADAGQFSVPSKILSFLCASRPIVAALPAENLAARTIERAEAGFVTKPADSADFIGRLEQLLDNPPLADRMGAAGRSYAERNFSIQEIALRLMHLISAAPQPNE
jgi:glycosyltransferase involved in cell wall biosynthesis